MRSSRRILIFGNSGSGKSTLARKLVEAEHLAHLDLDVLAWLPTKPPVRRAVSESGRDITNFIQSNDSWVIDGGYTDLLELAEPFSTEAVFLDLSLHDCVNNAQRRPWEPHKYESREAQDQNLEMLIGWIRNYPARDDVFSRQAHIDFYQRYDRKKERVTDNKSGAIRLGAPTD